jgi:DNA-binding response OmpR family regulator
MLQPTKPNKTIRTDHAATRLQPRTQSLDARRERTPARSPGAAPGLRVALLDHDNEFVRPLAGAMRRKGWKVAELTSLPNRSTLAAMDANVLLLDVAAVAVDSGWLARQRAATPELAIIVCSGSSTVAERVRNLREGLDGWIAKPCDRRELLARVNAIARARFGDDTVRLSIRAGEIEVSTSRYDAVVGTHNAGLTTREFEVLELLAHNDGSVLNRSDIYAGVWGDAAPAGARAIDIFVGRIRMKLARISPGWRYLHTHPGVGYRFSAERRPDDSAAT